jgi:DNA-binding XRE family transcriptional regulator
MERDIDIQSLRTMLGWTQNQMAEFLGVDRSSVSRMEGGQPIRGPIRRLLETLPARSALSGRSDLDLSPPSSPGSVAPADPGPAADACDTNPDPPAPVPAAETAR